MNKRVYRVIDANFNRAREGLRVCEEFARFFLNDKVLTENAKKIRNRIGKLYGRLSGKKGLLISARNVASDVGKIGFHFERDRSAVTDVFWANIQRSKEALRVLEEFIKLDNTEISDKFRILRFHAYDLEKKVFKKLKGLK